MILHLVSDHFATNACLKIFEEKLPGQNKILVFKHFGYKVNNGIVVTDKNASEIAMQIDFKTVTHIVVSLLSRRKVHFIRKYVPANIPIVWWVYGADLYANFLEKRGFEFSYSKPDRYRYFGGLTFPLIKLLRFFDNFYFRYIQDKYVINRLAGFVPCIQPEYDLLRQYVKKDFSLIRIHSYGASYKFDGRFTEGKDIALGHSASITDNHLYALNFLKKLDLRDAELYLTLSYSNQIPKYTEEVKQKFKAFYGDKVHLIETMMPKDEYFQSQFRYKAMILPSWRQEALDNIYTCLQMGIKLILSERSVVYRYLKDFGFIIYSIEQLTQECLDSPLELEAQRYNQQLFMKFIEERKVAYYSDFEKYFMITKNSDE